MNSNKLEIEIHRPINEVFEFTTNPANTHKWIETILKEKIDTSDIQIGTIYSNTQDDLNWTNYRCTDFKKDKTFELKEEDSLYNVKYTYEPLCDSSTKLIYFEWMEDNSTPLSQPFEMKNLKKLKEILES
jgi:hypothetical protein